MMQSRQVLITFTHTFIHSFIYAFIYSLGGSPSKGKNKKKKSKSPVSGNSALDAATTESTAHHTSDLSHMDLSALTKYIRDAEIQKQKEKYLKKVKTEDDYKFWNTQPGNININYLLIYILYCLLYNLIIFI